MKHKELKEELHANDKQKQKDAATSSRDYGSFAAYPNAPRGVPRTGRGVTRTLQWYGV